MQQDQAKLSYENKFYCELHSEQQLQSIYFGEKQNWKSRLLCEKCLIDIINNQEKMSNLVFLKDFITNPAVSLLRAAKITENEKRIDENEALQEIEKLLMNLEESIKSQLIFIRQNIQEMKQQLVSITTQLSDNLKLNELIKQFELVRNMDSSQGTKELAQLEEQLNQISVNLKQTYLQVKQKVEDNLQIISYNYNNNFKIIQNEVESTNQASLEFLNKIVRFGIIQIICDDINQFPQIHEQISEGKQIYYKLLYQGTRDGLEAQYYWSKCNGQSNLLTIMTSKNGNKFGGYSPCVINSGLGYVKDPTMKSFLFQYNKKEIYKLKENSYTVYCNAGYGPTYGNGHDIYILLLILMMEVHKTQVIVMIHKVTILLIKQIIYLAIKRHNYRRSKFIRSYFEILNVKQNPKLLIIYMNIFPKLQFNSNLIEIITRPQEKKKLYRMLAISQ